MHPITPSSSTQPTFSFGLSSNVKSFGMDPGASTPFFGPAKPASTTTSTEDFTHGICTLHQAVQGQDIAIIDKHLLSRNIKHLLSQYDHQGLTPFHLAIQANSTLLIQGLLSSKADINQPTHASASELPSSTPLHLAIHSIAATDHTLAIVKLIIKKAPHSILNARDINGNTPLHLAILKDNFLLASILIKKQANTAIQNSKKFSTFSSVNNDTPLHLAIKHQQKKIAQLIIDSINPDALDTQNADSDTPLHLALKITPFIQKNRAINEKQCLAFLKIAKHIIQKISERKEKTHSAFSFSTTHSNILHIQNSHGNTPLHLALSNGYEEPIYDTQEESTINQSAIKKDIKRFITHSSSKSIITKKISQYYLKLIQLIIEKNGITSLQNLTSIIKEEPRPTFGQTTTITTTGIPNNTPLHLALMRSDLPETVIANLAEHGHNSTPDQYGNTPLHLALATIQTKIALTITKKIIIQSTHKQTLYEENNNNQSPVNIAQKQIMKLQSTSPQSPLIQELNSIIQLIEDNQEKKIEADPDLLF